MKIAKLLTAFTVTTLISLQAIGQDGQRPPGTAAPPAAAPTTTAPSNAVPSSTPPSTAAPQVGPSSMAEPSSPPPGLPTSSVPDNYLIGPGDIVQVFVWRNPELSVQVPVRPDGKISTPLVEDMVAVGKTPSGLARDLESVLGEYVRSPKVSVIVSQPMSIFSQVKVIGQVLKPQALPYRQGLTVLDAVLAVGGLTQFAAGNRAKIMRTDGGHEKQIRVKLSALVNGGDMRQNVELQPGDVLVVPESVF